MTKESKIDEILNAAFSIIGSKGYLKTSMNDIADAVQLTKGGLYHYFDKKEDILVMIHDRMANAFLAGFQNSVKTCKNAKEKLANCLRVHVVSMQEYQPYVKIFFKEIDNLKTSEHYNRIISDRDHLFNFVYEIIKEGQKEKYFKNDVHPKILTFLIMGMLNWFYQWYKPEGPRSINKIVEDVQNLVFEGILVDAEKHEEE